MRPSYTATARDLIFKEFILIHYIVRRLKASSKQAVSPSTSSFLPTMAIICFLANCWNTQAFSSGSNCNPVAWVHPEHLTVRAEYWSIESSSEGYSLEFNLHAKRSSIPLRRPGHMRQNVWQCIMWTEFAMHHQIKREKIQRPEEL